MRNIGLQRVSLFLCAFSDLFGKSHAACAAGRIHSLAVNEGTERLVWLAASYSDWKYSSSYHNICTGIREDIWSSGESPVPFPIETSSPWTQNGNVETNLQSVGNVKALCKSSSFLCLLVI